MVCEKFRSSRIVAYSTGNVYAMVPAGPRRGSGGLRHRPHRRLRDELPGPRADLHPFQPTLGIPVALLRLNYAHEMRYGVMVDLAQQVLAGRPIDLAMGYFNAIWQGDSNAMTLRAFDHVGRAAAGDQRRRARGAERAPRRRRVRPAAGQARRADRQRGPDALLSNGRLGYELLGRPGVTAEQMIRWIADWQFRGGPTLGKPTQFQVRDGRF